MRLGTHSGEPRGGGDSGGGGARGRDGQWRKVAANGQEGEDDDEEIDSESTRLLVDAAGTTSHRAVTCST